MKKLFILIAAAFVLQTSEANAQGGQMDPQQMLQRTKERVKPMLMEKTKLTDEQADKVIEAQFEMQMASRPIRMDQNMSNEDKKKKMDELQEARKKKLKAIPLTDDQIKSVDDFYEEMRKNMQQMRGGGGGN